MGAQQTREQRENIGATRDEAVNRARQRTRQRREELAQQRPTETSVALFGSQPTALALATVAEQQMRRGGSQFTKPDLVATLARLKRVPESQLVTLAQGTCEDLRAAIRLELYDTELVDVPEPEPEPGAPMATPSAPPAPPPPPYATHVASHVADYGDLAPPPVK